MKMHFQVRLHWKISESIYEQSNEREIQSETPTA